GGIADMAKAAAMSAFDPKRTSVTPSASPNRAVTIFRWVLETGMRRRRFISLMGGAAAAQMFAPRVAHAQQTELKMTLVVNQDTAWGRAAQRFADAIKYRTQGRVQVRNYFEGQLFA